MSDRDDNDEIIKNQETRTRRAWVDRALAERAPPARDRGEELPAESRTGRARRASTSCLRAASADRGPVFMMQPERALRFLDTLDGMAYAVRLACVGYWGRRLRLALLTAGLCLSLAVARLPGLLG